MTLTDEVLHAMREEREKAVNTAGAMKRHDDAVTLGILIQGLSLGIERSLSLIASQVEDLKSDTS
jgi:hypothetical protein